jgi:hypothetical protein
MGQRCTEPVGIFCGNVKESHELGIGFFMHTRIISAVKGLSLLVIGCCT